MRGDIPNGLKAANILHAAGGSSPGDLPDNTFAVALQATEPQLKALIEKLRERKIKHYVQVESDGDYAGQIMAVGIAPCDRHSVKCLVSSFGLVR